MNRLNKTESAVFLYVRFSVFFEWSIFLDYLLNNKCLSNIFDDYIFFSENAF